MSNIHRKYVIEQNKLKSLTRKSYGYLGGAYFDTELNRYVKLYVGKRSDSFKSYLKCKSIRTIRGGNKKLCYDALYKDDITYTSKKSCNYKKLYDFGFNLY